MGVLGQPVVSAARSRPVVEDMVLHQDDHRKVPTVSVRPGAAGRAALVEDERSAQVHIVIRCAGPAFWTERCIDSVMRHTDLPFTVTLVADTDDSYVIEVIESFAGMTGVRTASDPQRLRQLLEGSEPGAAVHLHDDTVVGPAWASTLVTALRRHPTAAATGPVTNHADGPQGFVELGSYTSGDLDAYARHYNWSDPSRWFHVASLARFAVCLRLPIAEHLSGLLDKPFSPDPIAAGEGELVCAADAFVFHAGSETLRTGDAWRSALVVDGIAHPILTPAAEHLAGQLGEVVAGPKDLPTGRPVALVRGLSTGVHLAIGGERRPLAGDPTALRRLRGVVVLPNDDLATLRRGDLLHVPTPADEAAADQQRLPVRNNLGDRCLGSDSVLARITQALSARAPLSLVRVGPAEELLLSPEGAPREVTPELRYAGVAHPGALRLRLCAALRDADIVGLRLHLSKQHVAILERVLEHHSLHPRAVCSHDVLWPLVRPADGRSVLTSPLVEALAGRRIAVVGRRAEEVLLRRQRLGLDVTTAVDLEDETTLDAAKDLLLERAAAFDVVLVGAGVPAVLLCPWAARTLRTVAIDIGLIADHLADPSVGPSTGEQLLRRWQLARYAADIEVPSTRARKHPRNGTFVRDRKDGALHYVESGVRRLVTSPALPALLGAVVEEVTPQELHALPSGPPVSIVLDATRGAAILLDGRLQPIDLGLPVSALDPDVLSSLPAAEAALPWRPAEEA